ncbi:MAG: phosphatidylserine decarboxylase, partial [Burkholderiales bacterium]
HPIIAREGWPFLTVAVIASLVVTFIAPWYCSLPVWLLSLFILQFFRDPPRKIPGDDRTIVSPADGRIVAVERAQDPYLQRDALKVSVFMNAFNVHSNRSPVAGTVEKDWYHPGKFLNAALSKASGENERKALWIKTVSGFDIVCVQVAGLIARRILCYVRSGDRLARGQRYGFIRFGSRVDVYLPQDVLVKTSIGDKVYASESVIAELPMM